MPHDKNYGKCECPICEQPFRKDQQIARVVRNGELRFAHAGCAGQEAC